MNLCIYNNRTHNLPQNIRVLRRLSEEIPEQRVRLCSMPRACQSLSPGIK